MRFLLGTVFAWALIGCPNTQEDRFRDIVVDPRHLLPGHAARCSGSPWRRLGRGEPSARDARRDCRRRHAASGHHGARGYGGGRGPLGEHSPARDRRAGGSGADRRRGDGPHAPGRRRRDPEPDPHGRRLYFQPGQRGARGRAALRRGGRGLVQARPDGTHPPRGGAAEPRAGRGARQRPRPCIGSVRRRPPLQSRAPGRATLGYLRSRHPRRGLDRGRRSRRGNLGNGEHRAGRRLGAGGGSVRRVHHGQQLRSARSRRRRRSRGRRQHVPRTCLAPQRGRSRRARLERDVPTRGRRVPRHAVLHVIRQSGPGDDARQLHARWARAPQLRLRGRHGVVPTQHRLVEIRLGKLRRDRRAGGAGRRVELLLSQPCDRGLRQRPARPWPGATPTRAPSPPPQPPSSARSIPAYRQERSSPCCARPAATPTRRSVASSSTCQVPSSRPWWTEVARHRAST
jgi:hypothetical protein